MIQQLFVSSYPQKQEAGKAGRENYKTFWLIFDKVVKLKRLYKHYFHPYFSALLFLLRQGKKIQIQTNIINYPNYNWNINQPLTTIINQQNILNLTTQIQTAP